MEPQISQIESLCPQIGQIRQISDGFHELLNLPNLLNLRIIICGSIFLQSWVWIGQQDVFQHQPGVAVLGQLAQGGRRLGQ